VEVLYGALHGSAEWKHIMEAYYGSVLSKHRHLSGIIPTDTTTFTSMPILPTDIFTKESFSQKPRAEFTKFDPSLL
jgi:hypothetical protein